MSLDTVDELAFRDLEPIQYRLQCAALYFMLAQYEDLKLTAGSPVSADRLMRPIGFARQVATKTKKSGQGLVTGNEREHRSGEGSFSADQGSEYRHDFARMNLRVGLTWRLAL